MKLKLIDTSAVLHSGDALFPNFGIGTIGIKSNKGNDFAFPTGAMYSVLALFKKKGFIHIDNTKEEDIVFCFDRKSNRKKEDSTYKANRKGNSGILFQSIELEKGLANMGFNTMAVEGLEADDLIYSLVNKYYNQYDSIEIYGTDRDLAALVDRKVQFISTNKNVPSIDINNFETKTIPGFQLPYNSIYLYKILFGDTSDTIQPAINRDTKGKAFFYNTINKVAKIGYTGQKLNSVDFINAVIKSIKDPSLRQVLVSNANKVLPRYVDLTIKPTILNEGEMIVFLSTFKMKSIAKRFNVFYDKDIGYEYINELAYKFVEYKAQKDANNAQKAMQSTGTDYSTKEIDDFSEELKSVEKLF
ncbi:hypothetical protein [Clostridium tertium]|uniref:hypothetical protein n=1 Tax=Clostridium tertium TaxID=1559 RepID=UPI0023B26DD5|nr:hypothetical protein [Clostridium tertium]